MFSSKNCGLSQELVHRLANRLLFIALLCTLCPDTVSKEYGIGEINRIENKAIANRKNIKTWQVRVSIEKELVNLPEFAPPEPKFGARGDRGRLVGMELFYDGELFREERVFLNNGKEDKYTTVLGKEWFYRFGTDVLRREGTDEDIPVLYVDSVEKEKQVLPLYDIRTLGFVPSGFQFNTEPLDTYIGNSSRSNVSMSDDTFDDIQCYKLSFVHPHIYTEHKISVWFSLKHDLSPLKFELIFPTIKQKTTYLMELKQDISSKIWFPSVIHTTVLRDNELAYENKALIEVVSFNKPLDPLLFTEKKLGLPIGTLALIDPEPAPGTYTWDGENIVDLSGATIEPYDTPRNYTVNYLLIAIALGLAMIFVWCLLKYLELPKKKRDESCD